MIVRTLSPALKSGTAQDIHAANIDTLIKSINAAKSETPDIDVILLPGGCISGGSGLGTSPDSLAALIDAAKAATVTIAGADRFDGKILGFIISPTVGLVVQQPSLSEAEAAATVHVHDTGTARLAVLVDGDLLHPEYARLAMFGGAEIILNPCAERSDERFEARKMSRAARAWENHLAVASCGLGTVLDAAGHPDPAASTMPWSAIWTFSGQLLVEGSASSMTADIDMPSLRERRLEPWINFPGQLRTNLYAREFAVAAQAAPLSPPPEALPRSHGERLRRWTDAFIASFDPTISAERKLELTQEILEFQMYFVAWRQKKIEAPADDLLSMLSTLEKDDGRRLGTEEYLALCAQLMVAGNETTRNHLLAAMLMLCEDPALQGRLRQDPALIPDFIEESLRLESPAQGLYRRCTQDIVLGGVTIPAGAIALVMYGAGNRDAQVFPEPARIDLARANRNRHLAFGHGVHTCIGRSLAMAELTIAFTRLLERLGNIRLSPDHPPPVRKFHFNMRALDGLQIVFDPA
jgi:predicted amidohydrolase